MWWMYKPVNTLKMTELFTVNTLKMTELCHCVTFMLCKLCLNKDVFKNDWILGKEPGYYELVAVWHRCMLLCLSVHLLKNSHVASSSFSWIKAHCAKNNKTKQKYKDILLANITKIQRGSRR